MKKLRMVKSNSITLEEGCNKYLDNCRARYLREGTSGATDDLFRVEILYNFVCLDGVVLMALVHDNHETQATVESICNMLEEVGAFAVL